MAACGGQPGIQGSSGELPSALPLGKESRLPLP